MPPVLSVFPMEEEQPEIVGYEVVSQLPSVHGHNTISCVPRSGSHKYRTAGQRALGKCILYIPDNYLG